MNKETVELGNNKEWVRSITSNATELVFTKKNGGKEKSLINTQTSLTGQQTKNENTPSEW